MEIVACNWRLFRNKSQGLIYDRDLDVGGKNS